MKSKGELILSSPRHIPAGIALKHRAVSAGPDADANGGSREIQPSLQSAAEHRRTALNKKYLKYVQMHFVEDNVFIFWAALF